MSLCLLLFDLELFLLFALSYIIGYPILLAESELNLLFLVLDSIQYKAFLTSVVNNRLLVSVLAVSLLVGSL